MYSIGDFVVCGNRGVCKVEEITTLDISGLDKNAEYYNLKPVYSNGSMIYIPVEAAHQQIRPILSQKEAASLVDEIADMPKLVILNEKQLEEEYKIAIRSNDARELVKLLKTIYNRRRIRFEAGRKETAVDAKYMRMATDYLFGELAVALDIPRTDVEDYIGKVKWEV